MKVKQMNSMAKSVVILGSAISAMVNAAPLSTDAVEVNALIKCHEGKFNAMNAVSQLTAEISGEKGDIYGWSGIGAYPDGHTVGHLVFVRQPVKVSAPSFVLLGNTPWACVTIEKK